MTPTNETPRHIIFLFVEIKNCIKRIKLMWISFWNLIYIYIYKRDIHHFIVLLYTYTKCPFVCNFQVQKVFFESKYMIYAFGKSNKTCFLENTTF